MDSSKLRMGRRGDRRSCLSLQAQLRFNLLAFAAARTRATLPLTRSWFKPGRSRIPRLQLQRDHRRARRPCQVPPSAFRPQIPLAASEVVVTSRKRTARATPRRRVHASRPSTATTRDARLTCLLTVSSTFRASWMSSSAVMASRSLGHRPSKTAFRSSITATSRREHRSCGKRTAQLTVSVDS